MGAPPGGRWDLGDPGTTGSHNCLLEALGLESVFPPPAGGHGASGANPMAHGSHGTHGPWSREWTEVAAENQQPVVQPCFGGGDTAARVHL